MDFNESKTRLNLLTAFAGESGARNRYTFYGRKAEEEGYHQISQLFYETAGNEKEHAELWLKFLHGGDLPSTADNLKDAAAGEFEEYSEMYPRMAKEAREEGFTQIARLFEMVAKIEKSHEERFLKLLDNVEKGKVFEKEEPTQWICRVCGHIHTGTKAPGICPVCSSPQSKFEMRKENY